MKQPILKSSLYAIKRGLSVAGAINTWALLTAFYFLLLVPIGVFFRMFGQSILRISSENSLWVQRLPGSRPEDPY